MKHKKIQGELWFKMPLAEGIEYLNKRLVELELKPTFKPVEVWKHTGPEDVILFKENCWLTIHFVDNGIEISQHGKDFPENPLA